MRSEVPRKTKLDEREFVLELIPGQQTKTETGMVDNRIFRGENKVFGVHDPQSNLWTIKYHLGKPPATLNQRFTSFERLHAFVEPYYRKRGLRIAKIND